MKDTFQTRGTLNVGGRSYEIARLQVLAKKHPEVARLPFSLKILLENLLRTEDGESVTAADIEALAKWDAKAKPSCEIEFTPARVLLQDFTGAPVRVAVVSCPARCPSDARRSRGPGTFRRRRRARGRSTPSRPFDRALSAGASTGRT